MLSNQAIPLDLRIAASNAALALASATIRLQLAMDALSCYSDLEDLRGKRELAAIELGGACLLAARSHKS